MSAGHDHAPAIRPESIALERALRGLLIAKGLISAADHRRQLQAMQARTPAKGAALIARAWVDPGFKRLLLERPREAAIAMGIDMANMPELAVVENTPTRHHLVVCTLCSCYPRAILGIPPGWYKSAAYRARAIKDPRGVLAEFGTTLPREVELRVVDSTADLRYLVLPLRPARGESLDEAALARLVTRDSMIGVGHPLPA